MRVLLTGPHPTPGRERHRRTIHCTGPLDVPALRAALDGLVARHPSLRTRFPAVDGRPVPVVDPPAPLALHVVDLSTGADPVAALARQPFDLERGPLFRATLLKTGELDHHLLLVAQHIVTDATSNHVLFDDLAAFLDGGPGAAPPVTYGEFAHRQRQQAATPQCAMFHVEQGRVAKVV